MDIDRARYFFVFSQTGSLTKAAEVLHISQPALSKALKLFEDEVGARLMEPDGRGLRLTEAGQVLRREIEPLLDAWRVLPQRLKGVKREIVTRVGSFEVFTTYFLTHLLKFEDIDSLEVHEFSPGQLEDAIAADGIDVGITYVPIPKSGVEFTEVSKIRMGVFGLRDPYQHMDHEKLPFVIPLHPPAGTPSKVMGLDGWPDHRYRRTIRFRVTMMESALELCRKGFAVAYLPEFVVEFHNQNVKSEYALRELKSPIPARDRLQSVFLVRRTHAVETKLMRNVAKALRALR